MVGSVDDADSAPPLHPAGRAHGVGVTGSRSSPTGHAPTATVDSETYPLGGAMADQACSACGGTGGTFKTEYSIELDSNGNQVSVARQTYSPCSNCGGSGRIG